MIAHSFSQNSVGSYSRKGFALIVALVLMGMIVLLLISLSVLTKVEIQSGDSSLKLTTARNNAIYAIYEGLGQLQQLAGPDQRVTATAEIEYDSNLPEPFWTGVWNTSPEADGINAFMRGEEPIWLVSHNAGSTPDQPSLQNPVTLFGADTSEDSIRAQAERLQIDEKGAYAYLILDEGVKANILPTEPKSYAQIDEASAASLLRIRLPHAANWISLFENATRPEPDAMENIVQVPQLGILLPGNAGRLRNNRHNLTIYSKSVLGNTAEGGLRKDLTRILANDGGTGAFADVAEIFPGGPKWGILRSFNTLRTELDGDNPLTSSLNVRAQTDTTQGIYPLIAMVHINFGVIPATLPIPGTTDQYELFGTFQPVVMLVNPYNVSLNVNNYHLRIRLPISNPNPAADEYRARLQLHFGRSPLNNANSHDSLHTFDDLFGEEGLLLSLPDVTFSPGESKIFSLHQMTGYAPGDTLELNHGLDLIPYATMSLLPAATLTGAEKNGEIRLWVRWANVDLELSADAISTPLQTVRDVVYSSTAMALITPQTPPVNPTPCTVRLALRYSVQNVVANPHSGNKDTTNGARWLADYNPRATDNSSTTSELRNRAHPGNYWTANALYNGWHPVSGPNDFTVIDLDGDGIAESGYWARSLRGNETVVPLFDVLRAEAVSLASFRHAALSRRVWEPAYAVGNSYASPYFTANERDLSYELNDHLWDNFFLSTLDAEAEQLPSIHQPLPNTRLQPWEMSTLQGALDTDTSAANLLLVGGFNVNSTSTEAWRALLLGLQGRSVAYRNYPGNGAINIAQNATNTPFPRSDLPLGNESAQWRGFRSLNPSQIEALADNIVDQVKARGPFHSLAQFVNRDLNATTGTDANLKGALQAAIDQTSINSAFNTPAVGEARFLPYPEAGSGPRSTAAPGFLMQSDLLQVLGPVLSARSDTFVIRGYGCSLDPQSNEPEAEAWCEVIVQRFPDYIDSATDAPEIFPPKSTINKNLGRRFRILSFRWLNKNEV